MKTVILTLVLSIFSEGVFGQVASMGECPNIQPVKNFNTTAYQGVWYDAARFFFLPMLTGSCMSVQYDENSDGSLITQIKMSESMTNQRIIHPGVTRLLHSDKSGNVQLTFSLIHPVPAIPTNYQYKIIATDYDTYSISWSCMNSPPLNAFNLQSLWVLSRDREYPDSVRREVLKILRSKGLDESGLRRSNQNCHNFKDGEEEEQKLKTDEI